MNTEAAVSGTISIVILVLATLKRSGVLDKGWEVLKDRLRRRRENRTTPEEVKTTSTNSSKPIISPVSELQMYLDRLDRERARLDAELEVVHQFLKKKEKVHEPS